MAEASVVTERRAADTSFGLSEAQRLQLKVPFHLKPASNHRHLVVEVFWAYKKAFAAPFTVSRRHSEPRVS